jgi:dTDP-4-amino-4,6-dideoxygalactose transaminase
MKIPFLDLHAAHSELSAEIETRVTAVLRSGTYIGGEEVAVFEAAWAEFTQSRHCIGVGNGLDALTLSLLAAGVGPGDQVIVPAHTFIATWLSVTATGADPVPVDPAPGAHLIDADGVREALTSRTRAIVPVHLYGDPVDLDPILQLAAQHGILVIEDAAQAHGARYRGRRIGSHGHLVAWSFYPGKNLGAAGDAGAVTTNDSELAERVRMLANYGSLEKYVHLERGVNSRLDPIQAAVLRIKLEHLDAWNARRSAIAALYRSNIPEKYLLEQVAESGDPVHHLMVIRTPERDRVRAELDANGIQTGIHYPTPPHGQGAYRELSASAGWSLPVCDDLSRTVLSMPMGPHLSPSSVEQVLDHLIPALARR